MRMFRVTIVLAGLCAGLLITPFVSMAQDVPELVLPTGHTGIVTSVAFSPDGNYAVSGSRDGTIKLWEISTGREVRSFLGHAHLVSSVAFSPDGRYIISGSSSLNLWEVSTGRNIHSFAPGMGAFTSVAFSPDGYYVLAGRPEGTIGLWSVANLKEMHSFSGHTDVVTSVAFSPDGRYAVSGSADTTIRLWYVSTGKEERSLSVRGHKVPVYSVAFSPDGKYVIADPNGKNLTLWSVATGREVRSLSGNPGGVRSVTFGPDGEHVLAGCSDKTLNLWELRTGRRIFSLPGHTGGVTSVAFSPDGRYALSGSEDRTLKLWDLLARKEARSFAGSVSMATSVAFSPDGRYALSGCSDRTMKLWDLATGRRTRLFSGHMGRVMSVAFSPDGLYAISGSEDKTLKLWEVLTGREVRTFRGHRSGFRAGHGREITSVAFSPDGKHVLSGSKDNTLKLWEVDTGRMVRSFIGHTHWVNSVAFSPDGRYALSGSHELTLKLWDISTGQEIRTMSGNEGRIYSVAFSPDGRYALSGATCEELKLWDISTGQEVHSLKHPPTVKSVAFSPDGRYALSGSYDKKLRLWEVSTGRHVRTFSGHKWYITSATFSPDGQHILSSSEDGTMKLWEVSTGEVLLSRVQIDQTDWVVTTPDGRFDGSPDGIELLHYAKDNKSIPLDALFDRFYTPGLVAQVMSGREIAPDAPDVRKGIETPPLVTIVSPEAGQTLTKRTVEVVVEVVDQGGGVEDIRLYHNSKRVGGEGRGMKKVEGLRRTFTLSLVKGENTLRATAFSRDRTEAHPFVVIIQADIIEATADLYIVAVGIDDYENNRYDLKYCVADAQAVTHSLYRRGQDIFRRFRVDPIFDGNARQSRIVTGLRWVELEARPEDVFIFYYSGHGVMSFGSEQQEADFYLVPTDVTQMYGNDALLADKGISATQLRETCQRIEARKQLVILDACQSGAAVDTFAVRGIPEDKAIDQLSRSAGLTVIAATQPEQPAREFEKLGHGLFTHVLLQAIEGKADGSPKDGKVTVGELSSWVQDQIPELSREYPGGPQYPNVFMRGQDFPLTVP